MIYRIVGTSTFLVGSIHLVPKGVALSLDLQRKLVEQSQEVVFESDLDHVAPPPERHLQSGHLSDLLSKEVYEKVVSLSTQVAFPESVDLIKPWFVGMVLSVRLQISSGAVPGGVDRVLWDYARSLGKPMFVLEGYEVFQKIDEAPVAESVAALEYLASYPEQPVHQLSRIYEAWEKSDSLALDSAFTTMARLAPTIYRYLFDERNRLWMPSILKAIRENRRAVFVVGCGHIAHGAESIQIQLKNAGFSLEAVHEA